MKQEQQKYKKKQRTSEKGPYEVKYLVMENALLSNFHKPASSVFLPFPCIVQLLLQTIGFCGSEWKISISIQFHKTES